MKYNTLVRNKIPEIILKKEGKVPITHIASHAEYQTKLVEKLHEEVKEFATSGSIDHLVDIFEVLDALMVAKKIGKRTVKNAQEEKSKERGTFTRRIILDEA
ncbi:hypothetical protein EXS73_02795 [Candidatus Pacearchaeota archaeon]|nr:hypothetical protein [Candidatus Pacearchaeota archaeon]